MITVNFHGVRGSHPVSDAQMVEFGGCTSCVEIVKTNDKGQKVPLIIDSGTGIIKFGFALAKKIILNEYARTAVMLFTHMHHDHTEGFPFFQPIWFPFYTVHIIGMENGGKTAESVLAEKMFAPMFPVDYKDLKSLRFYHNALEEQVISVTQDGEPAARAENPLFEIRAMRFASPAHPKHGAVYYSVTDPADNTKVVCLWDVESCVGGDERIIRFAENADIFIHDTQYTEEEYQSVTNSVRGFGHSTYAMAVENAEKAGVKRLIAFHYNPRHNDKKLRQIENLYKGKRGFEFIMSYEGLSLTFHKGNEVKREKLDFGFSG
jgi:ribonuclease BN (tRNA processing enzyme)